MNKKGRKKISDNKIATIVRLREEGCTYEQICEKLGCGNSTISRYTIAQPTPIPVNVPKRTKFKVEQPIVIGPDYDLFRKSNPSTYGEVKLTYSKPVPVTQLDVEGVTPYVLEEIQKLLQQDKMDRELIELDEEYRNKKQEIRNKYNVK